MASNKKEQRKKFLKEHPICCFCGGQTIAEEPDHIPSRALFDDRQWPEGYIFPACINCNRITRNDEQVVAMISRMFPNPKTTDERKQLEKTIISLKNYSLETFKELGEVSVRDKRNAVKKYNLQVPDSMAKGELPLLRVDGPLVNRSITNFGRKLFLALYYRHAEKILSDKAGIGLKWYSNLQIENDILPKELAYLTNKIPNIIRCKQDLKDQFFYRYDLTECKNEGMFLAFFRKSFAILGYINTDISNFDKFENEIIVPPFIH